MKANAVAPEAANAPRLRCYDSIRMLGRRTGIIRCQRVSLMSRVVVFVVCGLLLAGCESLQMLPGLGGGASTPITLNLESDPSGAEVALSTGGTCQTPCALPVAATVDVTATFTLANHQPRTLTAKAVPAEKNFVGMESSPARFEPNPLYAELQPEPPKRKQRPAIKRPQTTARPSTPPPPAAPAPAASSAPAPASSSPSVAPAAPWPAPR